MNKLLILFFSLLGAEIDPKNHDDSLQILLSQNLVENDNDSFDEMLSQCESEQEYRKADSLDEFISQADEMRADETRADKINVDLPSTNSKAKDWLVAQPFDGENKENFQVVRRKETNEKFQVVNAGKTIENHFEVNTQISNIFTTESMADTGKLNNYLRAQRQDFLFKYLSREQELDQQRLIMEREDERKRKEMAQIVYRN